MHIGIGPPGVPNCYAMDDKTLENSDEIKDIGVVYSKLAFHMGKQSRYSNHPRAHTYKLWRMTT